MRRRILFLTALLLLLAALGGWLGWLTHVPTPRLELRAEDELHPCFFSDDGTELVTEFVSRKGDDVKRGFIAWDMATGREKERWGIPVEMSRLAQLNAREKHERHRIFCDLKDDQQMELHCYQVRPWRFLTRIKRDNRFARLFEGTFGQAHFSLSGQLVLLRHLAEQEDGDNRFQTEVWDLQTGKLHARLTGTFSCFSPDGAFVTTAYNGRLRHWRLPGGDQFGPVLASEPMSVWDWWADPDGKVLIRSMDQKEADHPNLRWIDIESGRTLEETPGFDFHAFFPGCPFGVGQYASPPGMKRPPESTIFRWAPGVPLQAIRTLKGVEVVHFVGPEEDLVGKTVLASEGETWAGQNELLGWLVRRGWLQDGPMREQVIILNLHTGEEELRFRSALSNRHNNFVLSPRGDLLACEAKLDPAAPAPRADTGEFPSFVQVWDLPAAWPWGRVTLGAAGPAVIIVLLAGLVRLVRRKPASRGA